MKWDCGKFEIPTVHDRKCRSYQKKNMQGMQCIIVIHLKIFFLGFLSFLMDGFSEMEQSDSSGNVSLHTVLHLHPQLAPVKVGVLSETQQRELCDVALQTSADLQKAGR